MFSAKFLCALRVMPFKSNKPQHCGLLVCSSACVVSDLGWGESRPRSAAQGLDGAPWWVSTALLSPIRLPRALSEGFPKSDIACPR